MQDTTLDNTLSSTSTQSSKDKQAETDAARKRREELRKGIIAMSGRGNDESMIRQRAYEKGGFDPAEIDSVLNEYKQLKESNFSGQPIQTQQTSMPDLSKGSAVERQSIAVADETIQMSNDALDFLNKGVETGPVAGRVGGAKQMLPGGGDEQFNQLDMKLSNIKANFMKSISGAAVSDQEVKRLSQFLPSTNDQEEVIRLKLEALKSETAHLRDNTYKTLGIDPNSVRNESRTVEQTKTNTPVAQTQDNQPSNMIVHPDTGEMKMSGFFDTLGQEIPALAGKIADRVGNTFNVINEEAKQGQTPQLFGEAGLDVAYGMAGAANDVFASLFKVSVSALPDGVRETASKTMQSILSTDAGKAGLFAMQQGGQMYEEFKKTNPEVARHIEGLTNIATAIPIGKGLSTVGSGIKNEAGILKRNAGRVMESVTSGKADDVIKAQVEQGLRPDINIETLSKQAQASAKEAMKQGFEERDVKFLVSMAPEDRAAAGRMINLADEVNTNARTLQRPIDIAGETLVNKLKLVTKEADDAGKAVGETAKGLRGQMVDATPIQERANGLLENLGITQTKKGLNFNKSVFKMTPQLQTVVKKFVQGIPKASDDAYNLHIFKKSIDELVNYGAQGEGLKGNAQSLLKSLRNATDEVLDTNFDAYNVANTRFKKAKEIVDASQDLFGKKNGLNSSVRGGQVLRGAFSNNTSRSRVYDLAERLDNFEQEMTGTVKNNALDQAMFAELLDKSGLYKTQAITGLAGQVETAVKKAGAIVEGVSNPLKGVATLASSGIEKIRNINPEQKKQILKDLLGGVLKEKKPLTLEKSNLPRFGMNTQDVNTMTPAQLKKSGLGKNSPAVGQTALHAEAKGKSLEEFNTHIKSLTDPTNRENYDLLPNSYLKKPKTIYRGQKEMMGNSSGIGIAQEGTGLYTTTDKNIARHYASVHGKEGVVKEMSINDIPKNPLYFRDGANVDNWVQRTAKKLGMSLPDFNEKIGINKLLEASGHDGVVFDMGKGQAYVKFPEVKNKQNLTDIWKEANKKSIGNPGFALHPEDKTALTKFIDAVRLKKDMSESDWTGAERLLTKAGISLDQPQSKLANIAEEIVSGKRKLVTVSPGTKTIISKK
ncbi:MAG: hypothetical protein WC803_12865 [Sphingomonas sp.]|jgi:hypothetical protein